MFDDAVVNAAMENGHARLEPEHFAATRTKWDNGEWVQVIPFFDKPCIVGAPPAELARPCKRQRGQFVNARVGRSTSGPVCGDCDSHSSALGVEIPVSEDFCVVLALLYCLVILGLLDLARLAADAIKADMAGAQKWKDINAKTAVNNALQGLLTTRHTEIKVEKLSKHFVSRKGVYIQAL